MSIRNPFGFAVDLVLLEEIPGGYFDGLQVFVRMVWVMVGDDPMGRLAAFDEVGGIYRGGMSPAYFDEVFFGGVLGLVDQEIAWFQKVDQAFVGVK